MSEKEREKENSKWGRLGSWSEKVNQHFKIRKIRREKILNPLLWDAPWDPSLEVGEVEESVTFKDLGAGME